MDNFSFDNYDQGELLQMSFFVEMNPYEVVMPSMGIALKSGSQNDSIPVECRFTERRYKLSDHYKCELEPVDANLREIFGRREFYQTDFESEVNMDQIHFKQYTDEHVEPVTWREPLCCGLYVEHSGYTIVRGKSHKFCFSKEPKVVL